MKTKLSDAARQARNQYIRAWRARNTDKVRETNLKYWERRAERSSDSSKGEAPSTKKDEKV